MNRAVQYERFGGPEVLELVDVPEQTPQVDEVLIAVRAAGLNPIDVKSMSGQFPVRQLEFVKRLGHPSRWFGRGPAGFPRVLGRDFAGVVEAVGVGVTGFAAGDSVLGTLRSAPGDGATRGTLISQLVAPACDVVHKPKALRFELAAVLGVVAQTACGALRALHVGAGDVLAISGASGSVGSLATQLAVRRGATVIGIGGEANAGYVSQLGATPVSYGGDVAAKVRAVASGRITTFLDCFGGDYVTVALGLGVPARRVGTLVPSPAALLRGTQFTGSRHALPGDLDMVADLVASGTICVDVGESYAFEAEAVRAACLHLLEGHRRGKMTIEIA